MRSGPVVRAMLLLVFAMLLLPLMDTAAKSLSTDYDLAPASVGLGRFAGQFTFVLLGIALSRTILTRRLQPDRPRPTLMPARPLIHMVRGALHGGGSMLFFVAVKYMPLADTIAVFFIEPMILLALSALFLGEYVGWPRRIASAIGFCGALLVVQPSYELFGAVALLPLLAALMFAVYLLITRRFSAGEHPVTMQLWSAAGGMITIGACIVLGELLGGVDYRFTLPNLRDEIALIAVMGVISTASHIAVVMAYQLAPASVLAPFSYLEIVSATIFGYVVFDEFPGGLQWVGIVIIVGTGFFIFLRERHLELQPAPVGDARVTPTTDVDDAGWAG